MHAHGVVYGTCLTPLTTFLQAQAAKVLINKYNTQLATTLEGRTELLQQLLGGVDAADPPFIEPPFYCDYGYNIHMGSGSYANFGLTVLDACRVEIGKRVLIGPNVQVWQECGRCCARPASLSVQGAAGYQSMQLQRQQQQACRLGLHLHLVVRYRQCHYLCQPASTCCCC